MKYLRKSDKRIKKPVLLAALAVLAAALVILVCGFFVSGTNTADDTKGAAMTLEDYDAMDPEEKEAFANGFASVEEFKQWYQEAELAAQGMTIDLEGRNPNEFTWEEFAALTPEQQAMFPNYFDSPEEFDKWYAQAQEETSGTVAVDLNGKKAEDFTWEEFRALTPDEKAVFPDYFESYDAFQHWYDQAQGTGETKSEQPSVENEKAPGEYTWGEFMELSPEEQAVFPDRFENEEAFQDWWNRAAGNQE